MPVDRKLFKTAITTDRAPPWICPSCASATLILEPETLKRQMTGECYQSSDEDWFDAEHVEYRFTALLKCPNTSCTEVVVVAGRGRVDDHPDDRMEQIVYEDQFFPEYLNPSPALISIPARCPASVATQLSAVFIASWSDYSSAANRIRVAVELLLDSLRTPKTSLTSTGARRSLSLHKRIEGLPPRYADVRDHLLAIKWLGNYGSHEVNISQDSVYDALDIFEAVLDKIYSSHPRRIQKLVAAVNKRRGPQRARK